jgi:hypothetical protein
MRHMAAMHMMVGHGGGEVPGLFLMCTRPLAHQTQCLCTVGIGTRL